MSKYQEHLWRVHFKNTYATLNQAYAQMVNEHGGELPYFEDSNKILFTETDSLAENLAQYIKVKDICPTGTTIQNNRCIGYKHHSMYNYYGAQIPNAGNNTGPFSDGLFDYNLIKLETGDIIYIINSYNGARVAIDVNGTKGPNAWGKDMWGLQFSPKKISPYGYSETGIWNKSCNKTCSKTNVTNHNNATGLCCTFEILKDIDYVIGE